jgi:acyl carrier protein
VSPLDRAIDGWVAERCKAMGRASLAPGAVLHDEGLLDSVSLVELLQVVEQATGREVDLLDLDLDALTTVDAVKAELGRVVG